MSTACFYPMETEKTLEHISKAGFDIFEVFVNSESEYQDSYIKKFNKIKDFYGLTLYSYHPFTSYSEAFTFFSDYKRRAEDGIESYKHQFEAAVKMGAKVFNFHGDAVAGKKDILYYCEIYSKLYEIANKAGVIFSQENISYCKSASTAFINKMREQLSENVKFTLDIKQANKAGISPFEMLSAMQGAVVNYHISDFDEEHSCLLPGCGKFDLVDLTEKLSQSGYSGPAIIEVYRHNYKDINEIYILKSNKFFKEI